MTRKGHLAWLSRLSKVAVSEQSADGTGFPIARRDEEKNNAPSNQLDHDDDNSRATIACGYHRAIIASLTVFGLFYPKHFVNAGARWRLPLMVYSSLIMLFLAFNAVRIIITIFDSDQKINAQFFVKASMVSWHLVCLANFVIHYVSCFFKSYGVASYYMKFNTIIDDMDPMTDNAARSFMRKFELGCLIFGWLFYAANAAYMVWLTVDTNNYAAVESMIRLQRPNSTSELAYSIGRGIEIIACVYSGGVWIWPVIYFVTVCMQLTLLFDGFNRKLEHMIASVNNSTLEGIGLYRHFYCRLCTLVQHADGYFKIMLGLHLGVYLVMSMAQLYVLLCSEALRSKDYKSMLLGFVVWFLTSVAIIVTEFVAACVLSSKIKAGDDHLQDIPETFQPPNTEQLLQTQLFLTRVNQSTGFTIMGCFPISKKVSFTILGTWVTYFLLILQFSPPGL